MLLFFSLSFECEMKKSLEISSSAFNNNLPFHVNSQQQETKSEQDTFVSSYMKIDLCVYFSF